MARIMAWLVAAGLCAGKIWLPSSAQADGFGLLLTSPQERALLRKWQHGNMPTGVTISDDQPITHEADIHYNGMVVNSRGKTSHWVNGRWVKIPEQAEQLGVSFISDLQQGLEVKLHRGFQSTKTIHIQPGETYQRHDTQLPQQQH